MIIGLVRHGESEGNVRNELSSNMDDKICLTNLGRQQIRNLQKDPFFTQPLESMYASPFLRTLESADILKHTLAKDNLPLAIDPRIAEENYGLYSGTSLNETKEALNETFRRITAGDHVMRMGVIGENRREFLLRVYSFLLSVLERHDDNHNILVVTHSSVISALEKIWIRLYQPSFIRESTKNGQLKRLTIDRNERVRIKAEIERLLLEQEYQEGSLMGYSNEQLLTFSPAVEYENDITGVLIYAQSTCKFYENQAGNISIDALWFSGILHINHLPKDTHDAYPVFVQHSGEPSGKEVSYSDSLRRVAEYIEKFSPQSKL